jgi:predicted PurR-regulated permease PerM
MLIGFFGGIITLGVAGFVIGPVFIVLLFHGYQRLIEEKKGSENTKPLKRRKSIRGRRR